MPARARRSRAASARPWGRSRRSDRGRSRGGRRWSRSASNGGVPPSHTSTNRVAESGFPQPWPSCSYQYVSSRRFSPALDPISRSAIGMRSRVGDHEQARCQTDRPADLVGLRRARHHVGHHRRRVGEQPFDDAVGRLARHRRHRSTGSARPGRRRRRPAPCGATRRAGAARMPCRTSRSCAARASPNRTAPLDVTQELAGQALVEGARLPADAGEARLLELEALVQLRPGIHPFALPPELASGPTVRWIDHRGARIALRRTVAM